VQLFFSGFERKVRRFAQRVLGALFHLRRTAPFQIGQINRILLVRTDKIGDAIVSTPVLQALRQHYPDARIDVVLGRRNRAAGPLLPFKDRILVAERGVPKMLSLIRKLRAEHYDLAIDMLPSDSVTAAVTTVISGAAMKIGFEDSASAFYNAVVAHPAELEHHVPRLLRLLTPMGIVVAPDQARPSLALPVASQEGARAFLADWRVSSRVPLVLINISGSSPRKFWGVENFVALAREIARWNVEVGLLSSPADGAVLQQIAAAAGVRSIPPMPRLEDFAAVLSFADLVVSPDTSIVHIAAALDKPVVTLTGQGDLATEWTPWGVPYRVVTGPGLVPDITFAEAREAVRSLAREVLSADAGVV
jgi:ADP-heptose:LPS heptosyltransferase